MFDWFVLSMRMQVILDSSFAGPGSAPIWGGEKGEFRDWTRYQTTQRGRLRADRSSALCFNTNPHILHWVPEVFNNNNIYRFIIIIYRFLERHILKALWRFTILKINNLTNQKTIKSLSKKKGLEAPFECV